MDDRKKQQLFEKYDFSKAGILRRAGVDPQNPVKDLYHDIAGMVQSLVFECDRLGDSGSRDIGECEAIQDRIYKGYGWLLTQYLSIDWGALSSDDPDLKVFFDMKKALEDLGRVLYDFLEKARKELAQGTNSGNHQPFRDIIERIGTLMQAYQETREKIDIRVAS